MSILGQFQFRRDLASAWTQANPILLDGELGIESDTDKFKIGDGATAWNALPYGGMKGDTGAAGRGISNIQRTSGNGAAGTTDTYTITYTSAPLTSTFTVTNGVNGQSVAIFDEGTQLTAAASAINFTGSANATVNGNDVTVNVPDIPVTADNTPQPIAAAGSIGTVANMFAREDHTHAGVTSVIVNGGAAQQGAVALSIPPTQLTALRSGLFTSTANSTAIQDVLTLNVPANYPLVGKHFSFLAFGTQSQSAAATNVVFIIAINDVAVATATVAGGTAAQTNRALVIEGMLQFTAVGAAGQVMGGLEQTINGILANSQTNVAGVAVNTTAPMTLKIRCQTSTANAANIIRVAAASITER